MHRTRLPGLPSLVEGSSDKGEQGDLPCLFDRGSHDALVARARPGLAARADLASLGDVAAEQVRFLVVTRQGLICAELTGFGLREEAAFSAGFLGSLWSSIFSHLVLQYSCF